MSDSALKPAPPAPKGRVDRILSPETIWQRTDLLKSIVNDFGDGLVVVDRSGKFVIFNPMAESILGVGPIEGPVEEWPARFGVFRPDATTPLPAEEIPLVRALRGESSDDVDLFIRNPRHPDGVFISANGRPLRDHTGNVLGGVVAFRDVTARTRMELALEMRSRELEAAQARLERLVTVDGLTGVTNRRYFDEHMTNEWKRARRDRTMVAVAMIDVDFFKSFNDALGHQAGDTCLQTVAKTIDRHLRHPADFVSRYGGEEFAVVLPNTDEIAARTVAERLRARVEDLGIRHPASAASPVVTISVGVATALPELEPAPDALIEKADQALYRAKNEGRNRVVLAS